MTKNPYTDSKIPYTGSPDDDRAEVFKLARQLESLTHQQKPEGLTAKREQRGAELVPDSVDLEKIPGLSHPYIWAVVDSEGHGYSLEESYGLAFNGHICPERRKIMAAISRASTPPPWIKDYRNRNSI